MTDDGLSECFISPAEFDQNDKPANVVDGLFAVARGLQSIADSINRLGIADASTPMGAIELLSFEIRNGFTNLSAAVRATAEDD